MKTKYIDTLINILLYFTYFKEINFFSNHVHCVHDHSLCFCFVEDADQRFGNLETLTEQVEEQVHSLKGNYEIKVLQALSLLFY